MKNYTFDRVLVSEKEIKEILHKLAAEIKNDFNGEDIFAVCILKGSCIFFSDLIREIETVSAIDFMAVSSYGNGTESSGKVKIVKDLSVDIKGKNVLIVEDIIDSGRTIKGLKELLLQREPKKLKFVTMLDKPERREVDMQSDFVGKNIPDEFVVGYGLDYAEKYRNLKDIWVIK